MKGKYNSIIVMMLLLVATFVSGCMDLRQETSKSADYLVTESYDNSYAENAIMEGAAYDSGSAGLETVSVDRKTITTVDMTLEVDDAAVIIDEIAELSVSCGGYVSGSYMYDYDSGKEGYVTVRIPESVYPVFLENVETLGKVTSRTVDAQDVTEEYIDLSARLDNLKRQESRLQEILNMTGTVEEVLSVEKELERVRGEIESLTGRMNYLDDRIEFSTVTIHVNEPEPITRSWGIRNALSESVNGFISTVNALIILAGYLLPLVIVVLISGGVVIFIRKKIKK